MENNNNNNNKNTTIFFIAGIVVAIIVGIIIGYFLFFSVNKSIIKEDNSTTGGTENNTVDLKLDINEEDTQNGNDDYSIYKTSTTSSTINITNGTADKTKKCTYDVTYSPRNDDDYSFFTSSNARELTIQGTTKIEGNVKSSVTSFAETDLNNVTSKKVLVENATFELAGAGMEGKITWNFEMRFYNLAADQTSLVGKKILGQINTEVKSCEEI